MKQNRIELTEELLAIVMNHCFALSFAVSLLSLFKEEQIKKAIEIINIDSSEKQYKKIYDEVYSYLKKDFIANNYCDFQNNKCITQRHFSLYPPCRKNGW